RTEDGGRRTEDRWAEDGGPAAEGGEWGGGELGERVLPCGQHPPGAWPKLEGHECDAVGGEQDSLGSATLAGRHETHFLRAAGLHGDGADGDLAVVFVGRVQVARSADRFASNRDGCAAAVLSVLHPDFQRVFSGGEFAGGELDVVALSFRSEVDEFACAGAGLAAHACSAAANVSRESFGF